MTHAFEVVQSNLVPSVGDHLLRLQRCSPLSQQIALGNFLSMQGQTKNTFEQLDVLVFNLNSPCTNFQLTFTIPALFSLLLTLIETVSETSESVLFGQWGVEFKRIDVTRNSFFLFFLHFEFVKLRFTCSSNNTCLSFFLFYISSLLKYVILALPMTPICSFFLHFELSEKLLKNNGTVARRHGAFPAFYFYREYMFFYLLNMLYKMARWHKGTEHFQPFISLENILKIVTFCINYSKYERYVDSSL